MRNCISHPDRPHKAKGLCSSCYQRESADQHQERAHRYVLKKYGMTPERYWEMHDAQGGLCLICGNPETRQGRRGTMLLVVDHDHDTGEPRGLLCHKCNSGIGLLNDDPVLVAAALTYLQERGDA